MSIESERITVGEIFGETDFILFYELQKGKNMNGYLSEEREENRGRIETKNYTQANGGQMKLKDLSKVMVGVRSGNEENLDKEDYETLFIQGLAFLQQGLLDEAIEEFKLASRNKFNKSLALECYSYISCCYKQKQDLYGAVEWIKKALKLAKKGTSEYFAFEYDLISLYKQMEEEEEDEDFFNDFLIGFPYEVINTAEISSSEEKEKEKK